MELYGEAKVPRERVSFEELRGLLDENDWMSCCGLVEGLDGWFRLR